MYPWITRPSARCALHTCLGLSFCFHSHCCFRPSFHSFWFWSHVFFLSSCLLAPAWCLTTDFSLPTLWPSTLSMDLVPSHPRVPLLPVHFMFISCAPISDQCPPCQCFGRHLIPWIPTLALFIMQGPFCLFPSRRQTGEKGRKRNIGSLGLLVIMPLWCWVYQIPHDLRLSQDPVYLRTQDSLWHPGWPHSDGATQLPSQKSACIWCHYKIIFFPLAALLFN